MLQPGCPDRCVVADWSIVMSQAQLTSPQMHLPRHPRWPCGPKGWPLLGNLPALAGDRLAFFTSIAHTYGDVVGLRLGTQKAVLVNNSELIEQIFVKQHEKFRKNSFFWRQVTAIFGNGLLTSEGSAWQRHRRMAAPAFVSPRLESYAPVMVGETDEMLRTWQAGEIRDVHADMLTLTLSIASKTLFGCDVEEDANTIQYDNKVVSAEIDARFARPFVIPDVVPLPGHIRYRRAVARMNRMVAWIIEQRRRNPSQSVNFLSMLMQARDESGAPMSDRQLRDEVITFLLAGQETTALALSWSWYLLGKYPDVDAKLGEELQRILGGRLPKADDLPRLIFTQQVVTEAMRLFPPAWAIGRETAQACVLGDYLLPEGTTVFVSPWVLHRSARFFDDPEAFRPERWAGTLARDLPRFAYMPFGGGPRICIGNRFAVMEACLVLAAIAQNFSLEWQSDRPVVPQPSITLRPGNGVWVRLRSRSMQEQ